jgi:hypothetical protein
MVLTEKLKRPRALAAAVLLILASILPLVNRQAVHAYGLLPQRKITISSSANGATDVTYNFSFNTATNNATIQGIVVDFCSNSPIIGDVCDTTGSLTGFNLNEGTVALANQTGVTGFNVNAATTANKLVLTRATQATNVAGNTNITFDLGTAAAGDGVTNPTTTNSTFYARMIVFSTDAGATNYNSGVAGPSATNPGNEPPVVDAGGIALSTAAQITVTSKVQEKLTFCLYTSAANFTDCSGVTGSAVTLGDENGVLDTAGSYVDKTTKYNIATNASVDAIIRVKGDTLKTGTFDIAQVGAAAAASNPGNEQFGLCTYTDPGSTDGPTLTPDTPYNNGSCNTTTQTAGLNGGTGGQGSAQFAFDTNTTDGTMSTYGDRLATKEAGDFSTGVIAMIGNIANTTEAGIYTTTLTFVATGTY